MARMIALYPSIRRVASILGMKFSVPSVLSPVLSMRSRPSRSSRRQSCVSGSADNKPTMASADKFDLPLEDILGIVVEAYDETGHHLQAVALNLLDGIEQVAARILPLLGFLETGLDRGLDAEKDAAEARATHPVEQFLVLGEVHAGFRGKREWMSVALRPIGQFRQQFFDVALVTDEVVVNNENHPAPAQAEERVQFS